MTLPAGMTLRTLAARAGRAVLWIAVALILYRGLAGILRQHTTRASSTIAPVTPVWPDDQARAFATGFTTTYLTRAPDDLEQRITALQRFTSSDLATAMTAPAPTRQTVLSATVADVDELDPDHALITVAARTGTGTTTYLAVPVARHAGGLSVDDLPGLVAPPVHTQAPAPDTEPLQGGTATDVQELLRRFFTAYLAGDTGALAYLTPPGARIAAITPSPLKLNGDVVAHQLAAHGQQLLVAADVDAIDPRDRITYQLRYRVAVARTNHRWLVAALNPSRRTP